MLISELVKKYFYKATIRTGDTAELYVCGEGESREGVAWRGKLEAEDMEWGIYYL